jgi:hypothetical protein
MRIRAMTLAGLLALTGCGGHVQPPTDDAFWSWIADKGYECKSVNQKGQRPCKLGQDGGPALFRPEGEGGLTITVPDETVLGLMGFTREQVLVELANTFGWSEEMVRRMGNTLSSDDPKSDGAVSWHVDQPDMPDGSDGMLHELVILIPSA